MKIIHVNRQFIANNLKDGKDRPIFTMKEKGKTTYAREVHILGPSKMVYNADGLSCGARGYITTDSDVELIDAMTYEEAKNYGID